MGPQKLVPFVTTFLQKLNELILVLAATSLDLVKHIVHQPSMLCSQALFALVHLLYNSHFHLHFYHCRTERVSSNLAENSPSSGSFLVLTLQMSKRQEWKYRSHLQSRFKKVDLKFVVQSNMRFCSL